MGCLGVLLAGRVNGGMNSYGLELDEVMQMILLGKQKHLLRLWTHYLLLVLQWNRTSRLIVYGCVSH